MASRYPSPLPARSRVARPLPPGSSDPSRSAALAGSISFARSCVSSLSRRCGVYLRLAVQDEFIETLPTSRLHCIFAGELLPAPDRHVHETRLNFQGKSTPPDMFRGQDGGTRAGKCVEYDFAAARRVFDRVAHQSHRFHRGMRYEAVNAVGPQPINAGVMPDVGSVSATPTELDVVVLLIADAKNSNQFVLTAIERVRAGSRLYPDRKIECRPVNNPSRLPQLAQMPPVDADIMSRPIQGD